jgi:hypothetical protein
MALLSYAGEARKLFGRTKKRLLDSVPEESFGTPPERAKYEKLEFYWNLSIR